MEAVLYIQRKFRGHLQSSSFGQAKASNQEAKVDPREAVAQASYNNTQQ